MVRIGHGWPARLAGIVVLLVMSGVTPTRASASATGNTPVITVVPWPTRGVAGTTIYSAAAVVSGGAGMSQETVTFSLYGPLSAPAADFCTTNPLPSPTFTASASLATTAGGAQWTASITDPGALPKGGTYFWVVNFDPIANKDTRNAAAVSACTAAPIENDSGLATPVIATRVDQEFGVTQATVFGDAATVTASTNIGGENLTFSFYGPLTTPDSLCHPGSVPPAPIFTATVPLGANPDGTFGASASGAGPVSQTGVYYWVVAYPGDDRQRATSNACAPESVNVLTATATSLTASRNPVNAGFPLELVATVTATNGHTPTGTVEFLDGATSLGDRTVDGRGGAVLTVRLSPGVHNLTARFTGTGLFAGSTSPAITETAVAPNQGYWLVASDGGIFPFGAAQGYGSTAGTHLTRPIVAMAATPDGQGYWLVASDGGIFPFGSAQGFGSTGGTHLTRPIVGMAATPDGHGYWLVASDGGIFPFGDAGGYGSTGGTHLTRPIVGMAATPDGHGYWLVASDGGIFPFGDAQGLGSTGGTRLNRPIVGMAAPPKGFPALPR